MVVEQSNIDHIMRGLQSAEGVRLHNHRKKLRQRFDIIKKLGQGTYGKVQLGINKETGQEVAIKTIKKCKIETEADLVRIRREIQIMSSVRHPNIIHIYEVFENREKMVLVMEYAAGGELYDFLNERKVLEEGEARRIFRQISTAVYYCHKHKICHRDLKLENILLDEHGSAKIADFGLSNVYEEKHLLQTFCGSPLYASPEIVRGTPYKGPEVDCWSLGVLLYTLVYGAMPFDGSNFKRLVKQISNGDYFEPKKPSPASPLIKEMLTVDPLKRATIEKICSHWWVNESYNVSCLDIAEDLANQTPVRLDLLLSLAPPPENSEKLVIDEQVVLASQEQPPRSMSVGSLLDINSAHEDRRAELLDEKSTKRKLEAGPSETSVSKGAPKKKESRGESQKEVATTSSASATPSTPTSPAVASEAPSTSATTMDVDSEASAKVPEVTATVPGEQSADSALAPPAEAPKEADESVKTDDALLKDKPRRKSVKTVKKKVTKDGSETPKKKKSDSPLDDEKGKENKEKTVKSVTRKDSRASEPREEVGKEIKREDSTRRSRGNLKLNLNKEREKSEPPATPDDAPSKPTERRKSKIFETAEKFMSPEPKSPTVEKPKKVFIPGVKVSDFAKAFERKSSITPSTPVLKTSPSKKSVPKDEKKPEEPQQTAEDNKSKESTSEATSSPPQPSTPAETSVTSPPEDKTSKLKESARNIITNALNEEERKKVKKQILKPPVPRTKTDENLSALDNKKKQLTLQLGKEKATVEVHTPENTKFLFSPDSAFAETKEPTDPSKEKKTAKVNITLKSNTLPRRTSKAEIKLASPSFRTEVEHRVGDPPHVFKTQRSEVAFPVSAAQKHVRSASLEPESRWRERIIPIQMEDKTGEARDRVAELERQDLPARGRPPTLPYQRTMSLRSNSLSRQSTQDSDTESTVSGVGEPIRKSPREFIIPIAVEGGGYVTPRATSLEPSESMTKRRPFPRRISLFSDNGSEDESSWRHDVDEPFRLHRLRSSRPARADSLSGSEDEEDDGFEILTAENLFSNLLSRVRSLTQRLDVEDGGRPGFPRLTPFGPSQRLFKGLHEPLTRLSERSLSRELDNARWPRGVDVSDSSRSISRARSRNYQSESEMEPVSESAVNRRSGERKGRRSHSHSRTRSLREMPPEVNSKPVHTHARSWSDAGPTEAQSEPTGKDFYDILAEKYGVIPMRRFDLETPTRRPLASEVKPNEAVSNSKETRSEPSVSPSRNKEGEKHQTPSEKLAAVLNQLEGAYEKKEEAKETMRDTRGIPNDLLYSKKEKSKNTPEFLKIENNRLKDLSPKALELYEKTLGLYQKTVENAEAKRKGKEQDSSKKSLPTKNNAENVVTPEKLREEYFKNKKLRHYGNFIKPEENKDATQTESFRPISQESPNNSCEDSPSVSKKEKLIRRLSRELESELTPPIKTPEDCLQRRVRKDSEKSAFSALKQDDLLIKRLSRELEKEMDKEAQSSGEKSMRNSPKDPMCESPIAQNDQAKRTSRNKLMNTLEKKLEKLRASSEKKYIDKAIRSLRENSVGPKEVVSENFLIKRAVSLSECTEPKPVGKIQSTVNSVLGLFKKLDPSEPKNKQSEDTLIESTPPMLTPEASPTKDSTKLNASPKIDNSLESPSRRLSTLSGNNSFISYDSSSFVSPDSESFDSWSNCSDFGTPDELPVTKPMSPTLRNYVDDVTTESVGDRIRRKSFYSRFNERKKSRKSAILDGKKRSDTETKNEKPVYNKTMTQNLEKVRSPQPYIRSSTSADYSRKWYDDSRPRPFYKSSEIGPQIKENAFRKTSLDWTKTLAPPTFMRSHSQSSSSFIPVSSTLPRNFLGSYDSLRKHSVEVDRPFSPSRTPIRTFSPSFSPSPTFE